MPIRRTTASESVVGSGTAWALAGLGERAVEAGMVPRGKLPSGFCPEEFLGSEEGRGGEEGKSRGAAVHLKKKRDVKKDERGIRTESDVL